jgi:aminopeptidase
MPCSHRDFPPFCLQRLLSTVFKPIAGFRICILIDLDDPRDIIDLAFLEDPALSIQRAAYDIFYKGLHHGVMDALDLSGGEIYAYAKTGGSNLDMPDQAFAPDSRELSLSADIYPHYGLILCISTYSATAPLTAHAKTYGFRGATLHGVNPIILGTGLSVDYGVISSEAEKLRLGMTRADWCEADFVVADRAVTLRIELDQQEAQTSDGICHGLKPDVCNLPAGEVYFVPSGAEGQFPMRYEDGTLSMLTVRGGRIVECEYISGAPDIVRGHQAKIDADPMTGEIGELGFGTQALPIALADIQDEKILGTFHLATGRSDHLGGHLTPELFAYAQNATHDDILYAPHKTPEIAIPEVRLHRDGVTTCLLRHYDPSEYLLDLLAR